MKHFLKNLFLVIFLFSTTLTCSSAICTASTGSWESSATWSCGSVPTCADEIVIPVGVTVTITVIQDYSACPSPMTISIYGTLTFQTGKKLYLPSGSSIFIYSGGTISGGGGGGSSNLISIGGTNVWTAADGTVSGPTTLGSGGLPIELLSFTALQNGRNVDITWATATEINNDYFTIEKTKDGYNFETVGIVDGAGNSSSILNYFSVDNIPYEGLTYYRLKQTDFDGNYSYSNLVAVNFSLYTDFIFNIFPNPANGTIINISLSGNAGEEIDVVTYDAIGKESQSEKIVIQATGENIYELYFSKKIVAGIYMVTIKTKEKYLTQKLIIQ